jgi:hypothetical protein
VCNTVNQNSSDPAGRVGGGAVGDGVATGDSGIGVGDDKGELEAVGAGVVLDVPGNGDSWASNIGESSATGNGDD